VYDLGEQQVEYKGKTRYSNQVMLTFELAGLTIEVDGEQKPRQLSRRFAVSTSKKSGLRKFLTSWRGKAFSDEEIKNFNTDKLLGQTAMLQIVHDESGEYANIDGIMQIPRGTPAPTTTSELFKFNIDEWDQKTFDNLPEWIQETIKKSTQYQQMHAPETAVDFPEQEENPTPEPRARTAREPAAKAGRGSARSAANPPRTTRNSTPTTEIEEEPPF
jgi:hypothetical protein